MTDYVTISGQAEAEFIERKSRFIGCCRHVETEAEALAFLEENARSTGMPLITSSPTS